MTQPNLQQASSELLLCDDVLGKIYNSCDDAETKKALRVSCTTCYRSAAINSSINSLTIERHMTSHHFLAVLVSFPRLAQIKHLVFSGQDVGRLFLSFLGPEGTVALPRLATVTTLDLIDCELDSSLANVLAFQMQQITELRLQNCFLPDDLKAMAHFGKRLKTLTLYNVKTPAYLSLEYLCGNQLELNKLYISTQKWVTGLEMCLAYHPLQELRMPNIYFSQARINPPLKSSTLEIMGIGLNPTYPVLSTANFPALKLIEIERIDLSDVAMDVQRFNCTVASLVEFIPRLVSRHGDQDDPLLIYGTECDSTQFLDLLKTLTPLTPFFKNVKFLDLVDCNFGNGAMKVVASLFPRLVGLMLHSDEKVPLHRYSDPVGLSNAIQLLPDLQELEIVCEHTPHDTIPALTNAKKDFLLYLVAANDKCYEGLNHIKLQWDAIRRPRAARLDVVPLPEKSDSGDDESDDDDDDEW